MTERELSIIRALGEEFATVLADLQRTFEEKMAAQSGAFEEKLASLSALLQKHVTVDEVRPVLQAMMNDAVGAIPVPRDGRDYDPEVLQQAAAVRLQYPDLSLTALCGCFDPAVSKSGLSHRMKKLEALADALRQRMEKGQEAEP